jgi:tetratricopeptide (TPR) repeat protein
MKVFISSTYKDLIEYRAAAIEAVEGTSYQAIKMEVFGARSNEPIEACLKEIEQSDLFVGIYAHRYGYVPDGSDISITQMEYLHAKKLGRPIYCFVIDDENQPWLPKWIEDEPGKSKLKDFKGHIQTDHIVAFFTTPDDLGMKVANALSHYVANHHPSSESRILYPEPHKPTGSTLPHQPYFFGREKELKIIAEALSPESRTWGALIDGPGGIGKTALAIRAAHLAPDSLFDRKIFITAKVRELTPEGEKPLVDFSHNNYFSMLNELALELGEVGIPRLAPKERANQLRMAMAGKKILIIFDNLETIQKNERDRLFQFLTRLPGGSKAIVTSRRRADVDARVIRLDRLSSTEALQLIEELAKTNLRLAREGKVARRNLYEITNGNPLLIKWVCGQLGRNGSHLYNISEACEYIQNAPKGNDPLEYIFGDLLDTLTDNETNVLAALTHFPQPAKIKWIIGMTGLARIAAETVLVDLTDRSILVADNELQEFFLPTLASRFVRKKREGIVIKTGNRLLERTLSITNEYGWDHFHQFPNIDFEWPSITASMPILLNKDFTQMQNFFDSLRTYLDYTGRWDEQIELCRQLEEKAVREKDYFNAGWNAYDAGMIYYWRAQYADVLASANRASEYWKEEGINERANAIQLRGLGLQLKGNYEEAIIAHKEALTLRRSIEPESSDVSGELNWLANAESASGDILEAEQTYNEALRIAKKEEYIDGITYITGNLAALAIQREQWGKALDLASEALSFAKRIGRQEEIARESTRIAQALLHQNRSTEGLPYAQQAVNIYTRLRSSGLEWAQEVLAECAASAQKGRRKKKK